MRLNCVPAFRRAGLATAKKGVGGGRGETKENRRSVVGENDMRETERGEGREQAGSHYVFFFLSRITHFIHM